MAAADLCATFAVVAGIMTACGVLAAGQQNGSAPAPGEATIRVSVDLAQTDAVVVDRGGRLVRDLEARDFQLFDDGRLQTITNFSWVDVVPPAPAHSTAIPKLPPSLQPALIPRSEDLRRAMVLLVDDAGTSTADLAAILPVLRRFVAGVIQPGDLAAVMASRGGMGLYERLTGDKSQLNAAIERVGRRPQWLACDYVPPFVSEMNEKHFGYRPGDFIFSPDACAPADKNGALRQAILNLAPLPGRKAVVLFSHAFGASPANVALANRYGVVIYVLDPAGSQPSRIRSPGPGGAEGASTLATQTGGFRKSTTPAELSKSLSEVVDEMSGYYVLGYHVSRNDSAFPSPPAAHVIRVRVLRDGLIVRAREGAASFAGVERGPQPTAPRTDEELLRQALFSPLDAGGLELDIEPSYAASPRDPKTGKRAVDLRVFAAVENALESDRASLTLDAIIVALRSDGSTAASVARKISLSGITAEKAEQYRSFGILLSAQLPIRAPGDYQIRAAVRDPDRGKTGSAYTFLSLPDFNKGSFAAATPVLRPATWNVFAPGETAPFSCEIFGSAASRTRGEIQLFSETGPLGPPQPLRRKENGGGYTLEGEMPLASGMAPGEYAIRMVAWDSGAGPAKPAGSYWSRLRITR